MAIIEHSSTHWEFPEIREVISAIYLISLLGALNQEVLQPRGKLAVQFACAGLLLICGMAGQK